MKLLVVIGFHKGDRDLAVNLLSWIEELGTANENPCLLVADVKLGKDDVESVTKAAKKAFKEVTVITTPFALKDEKWPIGANWMFETAAKYIAEIHKRPWLWLEPDSVPMRASWLSEIEVEYIKAGRPFMGRVIRPNQGGLPAAILSGIAVYPPELPRRMIQRLISKRIVAWDVWCAEIIIPQAQHSNLFWIFHNQAQQPTYVRKKEPGHPVNAIELKQLPQRAAIVHTCKDGSLISILRGDGEPTIPQLIMAWKTAKDGDSPKRNKVAVFSAVPKRGIKFIHCVERHVQRDAESERRVTAAFDSWVELYKKGRLIPCHVWQPERDSSCLGDQRRLPFLKDILIEGMTKASLEDVIVLTNDDTILHSKLVEYLEEKLKTVPACGSFRLNFQKDKIPKLNESVEVLQKNGSPDLGRDLFAFKKQWLRDNWFNIPDFVLGELEWDLVMSVLIRRSAGIFTDRKNISQPMPICEIERGMVLHEMHERQWTNGLLKRSEAKLWNRRLATEFYADFGFPSLISMG